MKNDSIKICTISMSGGLDSTTLAYKAIQDGYTILPINIYYGQKNEIERHAFQNILKEMKRKFPNDIMEPVDIDLTLVLESSLEVYQRIRDTQEVKDATDQEFYTPSRNLLFSTLAAVIGEIAAIASGIEEVKIGLGIHQHTMYDRDYWDISPEFVAKLNDLLSLNDCMHVSMYAPYADQTKDEIVRDAISLGVPIKMTWTCYSPVLVKDTYSPCRECEACIERQAAGDKAGINDINDYSINGKE